MNVFERFGLCVSLFTAIAVVVMGLVVDVEEPLVFTFLGVVLLVMTHAQWHYVRTRVTLSKIHTEMFAKVVEMEKIAKTYNITERKALLDLCTKIGRFIRAERAEPGGAEAKQLVGEILSELTEMGL